MMNINDFLKQHKAEVLRPQPARSVSKASQVRDREVSGKGIMRLKASVVTMTAAAVINVSLVDPEVSVSAVPFPDQERVELQPTSPSAMKRGKESETLHFKVNYQAYKDSTQSALPVFETGDVEVFEESDLDISVTLFDFTPNEEDHARRLEIRSAAESTPSWIQGKEESFILAQKEVAALSDRQWALLISKNI